MIKNLFCILLAISCFQGFSQKSVWLNSFDDAKKLAIATNKLIIVDFYASWCGPCNKMEREAFQDPEIAEIMENYVLLKVNFDSDLEMRNRYSVRSIPYIFVIDGHGTTVNSQKGYRNKENFKGLIEKYRLNTSYLQNENIHYFQNRNYVTALRLAQKYMDYSLLLDPEIKPDFLQLAGVYLKDAEKMLNKKQANYELMSQKIDLLNLTVDLYAENYRKLGKSLNKIGEAEVQELNKDLYCFLQYGLARGEMENENLIFWKEKLIASETSESFREKIKIMFDQ